MRTFAAAKTAFATAPDRAFRCEDSQWIGVSVSSEDEWRRLCELLGQPVRLTEVLPGMVETDFSLVRFEGDEVYIMRDETTGDVILSARPRRDTWQAYLVWRDALGVAPDDADTYMDERPMNRPVGGSRVFEGEA